MIEGNAEYNETIIRRLHKASLNKLFTHYSNLFAICYTLR